MIWELPQSLLSWLHQLGFHLLSAFLSPQCFLLPSPGVPSLCCFTGFPLKSEAPGHGSSDAARACIHHLRLCISHPVCPPPPLARQQPKAKHSSRAGIQENGFVKWGGLGSQTQHSKPAPLGARPVNHPPFLHPAHLATATRCTPHLIFSLKLPDCVPVPRPPVLLCWCLPLTPAATLNVHTCFICPENSVV